MHRCAALDFKQFPPWASLARREAESVFRRFRRVSHCTAGTAPLHISSRKVPPSRPPRGGGALRKAEGCCPDDHPRTAYVLFIRGAPPAVCHTLLPVTPGRLPRDVSGAHSSGCHEEIHRGRIKVHAGDNKARNCLLLFRAVFIFSIWSFFIPLLSIRAPSTGCFCRKKVLDF